MIDINVFIGWILGVLTRPIISIFNNWIDKRKFKKMLKGDIKLKLNHLISIENRIVESFGKSTLDETILMLVEMATESRPENGKEGDTDKEQLKGSQSVSDMVSLDFYKNNYEKILDYFGNESNVIGFYERLTTLNSMVDLMEEDKDKGIRFYEGYLLAYVGHLKHALYEGKNIFDL